uniref:Hydrolase_4 domain-containing protein n=1 Tax=Caenorhabditis tropicalis TaxID=1561998 RepID=A0A1I7SZU7_9PELO
MKSLFEQKNIRMICTNYPGSEFVTGGIHNSFTNEDRNSYMKSLMEQLNLQKVNRLVIMGHSRGGENALQLTSLLSDDTTWPLVGAVMINSPGFAPHKGISKRIGTINFIISLIKRHNTAINWILHPILHWFYNNIIGLRVSHGKVAAAAILPMQTFAFDQQKLSIDDIRQKPRIRVFYGYGSRDFLIDEHQSEEVAMYFSKEDHFIISNKEDSEKSKVAMRRSFISGKKFVTANFTEEGHFLQKTYPDYIVEVVDSMFDSDTG